MKYKYIELKKQSLDNIKVGDYIKYNDWKTGLKVVGVSKNYIICSRKMLDNFLYSICEKKICDENRNNYNSGFFRIGTDNYIFDIFNYTLQEDIQKALQELEDGKLELSVRTAVNLYKIQVKKSTNK